MAIAVKMPVPHQTLVMAPIKSFIPAALAVLLVNVPPLLPPAAPTAVAAQL